MRDRKSYFSFIFFWGTRRGWGGDDVRTPTTWSCKAVLPRGQAKPGAVGWVCRPGVTCVKRRDTRAYIVWRLLCV